jgi:hypothetical protein
MVGVLLAQNGDRSPFTRLQSGDNSDSDALFFGLRIRLPNASAPSRFMSDFFEVRELCAEVRSPRPHPLRDCFERRIPLSGTILDFASAGWAPWRRWCRGAFFGGFGRRAPFGWLGTYPRQKPRRRRRGSSGCDGSLDPADVDACFEPFGESRESRERDPAVGKTRPPAPGHERFALDASARWRWCLFTPRSLFPLGYSLGSAWALPAWPSLGGLLPAFAAGLFGRRAY